MEANWSGSRQYPDEVVFFSRVMVSPFGLFVRLSKYSRNNFFPEVDLRGLCACSLSLRTPRSCRVLVEADKVWVVLVESPSCEWWLFVDFRTDR